MAHCWACLVLLPLLLLVLVQPAGAQQQLSQGLLAGRCLLMEQAQLRQLPGRQPLCRCLSVTMSRKLLFSHTALNGPCPKSKLQQAGHYLLMEPAQPRLLPGRQPLRHSLLSSTLSRKLPLSHTALNRPCLKSKPQLAGHCRLMEPAQPRLLPERQPLCRCLLHSTRSRRSGLRQQSGSCSLRVLCRRACTRSTPNRKHTGWHRRSAGSRLLQSRPASREVWAHTSPKLETRVQS